MGITLETTNSDVLFTHGSSLSTGARHSGHSGCATGARHAACTSAACHAGCTAGPRHARCTTGTDISLTQLEHVDEDNTCGPGIPPHH